MIGDQPDRAARDVSLWARIWARWKAWRRPRKHFFVNTRVTIFFGLVFMLDIRLIVALTIIAATLDSHTFLAGQDRAKGEAEIPFWLSLKPTFYIWGGLAVLTPFGGSLFRDVCLSPDALFVQWFGLALWKIESAGGLCAYPYSTYTFFVESLYHLLLIFYFYFCNFVVQRNIYSIFSYVNAEKAIERIKKSEIASKYLPPFIIVILTIFPVFIFYGNPDSPSRIPMPHVHLAYFLTYYMFLLLPILGLYIYFGSYARWRVP